jgi:predicted nucleotidyltransferase
MKRLLKKIVNDLSSISDVKAVVLYGSFARGENTSRSDIDLLILTAKEKTKEEIQNRIIDLELQIGKSIQPTIRTIAELKKTDSGLIQNIFKEGRILYIKEPADIPAALLLEHRPYLIYSFRLNNLSQKEKVKFNRALYAQVRKGYKYKGLLDKLGGKKLSPGSIIISHLHRADMERFFKKFNVQYEQLTVWK